MSDEKKITVKEFRMWLEGVEEMQEADWTPTPSQWSRIREKINTITDEAPQQTYTQPTFRAGPSMAAPTMNPNMPAVPAGPSMLGGVAPAMPVAPQAPQHGLFGAGGKVKTPDIDTQGKPYESSFA